MFFSVFLNLPFDLRILNPGFFEGRGGNFSLSTYSVRLLPPMRWSDFRVLRPYFPYGGGSNDFATYSGRLCPRCGDFEPFSHGLLVSYLSLDCTVSTLTSLRLIIITVLVILGSWSLREEVIRFTRCGLIYLLRAVQGLYNYEIMMRGLDFRSRGN